MYNGKWWEKMQNIMGEALKMKKKKKKRGIRFRVKHVCSHNYTLIIFVFLSNINRARENARYMHYSTIAIIWLIIIIIIATTVYKYGYIRINVLKKSDDLHIRGANLCIMFPYV